MIQSLLTIAIVWLTFKAVTRGYPDDTIVAAIGIMLGLLFGVISGISFIAGGWWSLTGGAIFLFTLAGWIHVRNTLPEDINRELAEYMVVKPELDTLREEAEERLKPDSPRLP